MTNDQEAPSHRLSSYPVISNWKLWVCVEGSCWNRYRLLCGLVSSLVIDRQLVSDGWLDVIAIQHKACCIDRAIYTSL